MVTTTRPVELVTGASCGIGKQTALALVEAGFDVPARAFDRQIRNLNQLAG